MYICGRMILIGKMLVPLILTPNFELVRKGVMLHLRVRTWGGASPYVLSLRCMRTHTVSLSRSNH